MPSLILLKPDCIERNLVSEAIAQITARVDGFAMLDIKPVTLSFTMLADHYIEHVEKPFYNGLIKEMIGKNAAALHVQGDVLAIRSACKIFRFDNLEPGYIGPRNLIHSSDSDESAAREIALWFPK